jgi:hypothetical protein
MKWQIAEEFIEEYIAKVHRTMTPRANKKYSSLPTTSTATTTPDQQSPLRARYPPSSHATEGTPVRPFQVSTPSEYMMSSPPASIRHSSTAPHAPQSASAPPSEITTPERPGTQRQYMPMSSPAPFYRYSSITTPGTTQDHSSPPSSGAIDLAETLVEFSSPAKLREPIPRALSTPSDHDESPSRPLRNGLKSSLGDLQGVDLLRGFEKISSTWREGISPVKDYSEGTTRDIDMKFREPENGMVKDGKRSMCDGPNGVVSGECMTSTVTPPDSQMTDVKMDGEERK